MWMGFAFIIHDTFISGSRSNSQGVGKDKFDSNYSGEELIDDIFLHYKMSCLTLGVKLSCVCLMFA